MFRRFLRLGSVLKGSKLQKRTLTQGKRVTGDSLFSVRKIENSLQIHNQPILEKPLFSAPQGFATTVKPTQSLYSSNSKKLKKLLADNQVFDTPPPIAPTDEFVVKHYELIEKYFGFNIGAASHQNIKNLQTLLSKNSNAKKPLSSEEEIIFEKLRTSFTLGHASNAVAEIEKAGKMVAVRSLEAAGKEDVSRHTNYKSGVDTSVYFVMGVGEPETPKFVAGASHTIYADLNPMSQSDPATMQRLWVSGHLGEYETNSQFKIKLGNVILSIRHYKNLTKEYEFTYPDGKKVIKKISFKDEIFAGNEVASGIALQFVHLLRLLGGESNPLVSKLFQLAREHSPEFPKLLEKIFSSLLPGYIYPEAKIIEEFNINKDYVHIKKNPNHNYDNRFKSVEAAVENGDVALLSALLKKGYPCVNSRDNLVTMAILEIKDQIPKLEILDLLIKYGVDPFTETNHYPSALHAAVEKGTAEDLEFLLSRNYPVKNEPLIQTIVNANGNSHESFYDLVDMACFYDLSEKLEVLKAHGADFQKMGYHYLSTAIRSKKISGLPNLSAILFLQKEGARPDDKELFNETPLMSVCQLSNDNGALMLAKKLIEEMHANVNAQLKFYFPPILGGPPIYEDPTNGMTALHFAAKTGNTELVKYLLSKDANPNLCTVDGNKPVDFVPKGNLDLQQLLSRDIPPLLQKKDVESPANEISHTQKVAVLLTGVDKGKRYFVVGKRRANSFNTYPYYCFPGGAAEKSDGELKDAALRELFEETAVDVQKIPQAKVTALARFAGFNRHTDHTTTDIFVVDVGSTPINVHHCDDLIAAEKIYLDELEDGTDLQITKNGKKTLLLGSNASIIKNCLIQQQPLSEDQKNQIHEQLLIEENGQAMLTNTIEAAVKSNVAIVPGTAVWDRLVYLLKNHAHLAPMPFMKENSVLRILLEANAIEAIKLLKTYGFKITESYIFRKNDYEQLGTILSHAIAANRVDLVKLLIALEPTLLKLRTNQLLTLAAENGNPEIMDILVNAGLNPNKSFEETTLTSDAYPLVSTAIQHNHADAFIPYALNNKKFYLNRERTPDVRNSSLMNSIVSGKKSACYPLLASYRLDLSLRNNPNSFDDERKMNALGLAKQKQWNDIANVIEFNMANLDMNDYLMHCGLPAMDEFSFEQKNNTTVVKFMSDDLEKVKRLHAYGENNSIQIENKKYALAFTEKELALLVKSEEVAKYLLTYTKDSIFWSIRSPLYKKLQKKLVANTLTTLNVDMLDRQNEFNSTQHKEFYAQLIRENASISNIKINLNYPKATVLQWLLESVNKHDKAHTVTFAYDANSDTKVSKEVWEQSINVAFDLPALKQVHCQNLPFDKLVELVQRLETTKEPFPALSFEGNYSEQLYTYLIKIITDSKLKNNITFPNATNEVQTKLSNRIIANQVDYYSVTDMALKMELRESERIQNLVLSSRAPFKSTEKNLFLNKINLLKCRPKTLSLDSDAYNADAALINQFLTMNKSLESIQINSHKNPGLHDILNAVATADMPLKTLSFCYVTFNEEAIKGLIAVIKKHGIVDLSFPDCTFSTNSPTLIAELAEAIAQNSKMTTLNFKNIQLNKREFSDLFVSTLMQSKSLLAIGEPTLGLALFGIDYRRLDKTLASNRAAVFAELGEEMPANKDKSSIRSFMRMFGANNEPGKANKAESREPAVRLK